MNKAITIGLDLAKNVFQVHGVDAAGETVIRRQLRRRQVTSFFEALPQCLVGIEACATSHYWARELQALGHQVRIMPANYVKPYVKRNKNDAADAEAICEAVTRPSMRFVAVKSAEQQSLMVLPGAIGARENHEDRRDFRPRVVGPAEGHQHNCQPDGGADRVRSEPRLQRVGGSDLRRRRL